MKIERASVMLHRRLFPDLPDMSICAHAAWRSECRVWAVYVVIVDWLWRYALRGEANHCRRSWERWLILASQSGIQQGDSAASARNALKTGLGTKAFSACGSGHLSCEPTKSCG